MSDYREGHICCIYRSAETNIYVCLQVFAHVRWSISCGDVTTVMVYGSAVGEVEGNGPNGDSCCVFTYFDTRHESDHPSAHTELISEAELASERVTQASSLLTLTYTC